MDRQRGLYDPANAEAVQHGRKDGGHKGGAAGKGVKKPRLTAAEKELLPQGLCSGSCGKQRVW
jgi:hypothetical protein